MKNRLPSKQATKNNSGQLRNNRIESMEIENNGSKAIGIDELPLKRGKLTIPSVCS